MPTDIKRSEVNGEVKLEQTLTLEGQGGSVLIQALPADQSKLHTIYAQYNNRFTTNIEGDREFSATEIIGAQNAPNIISGGIWPTTVSGVRATQNLSGGNHNDFINSDNIASNNFSSPNYQVGDNDIIQGLLGADTINSAYGDDVITGSDFTLAEDDNAKDIINSGGGNDIVFAFSNDEVNAGEGNDNIFSVGTVAGQRLIDGGNGDDFIYGNAENTQEKVTMSKGVDYFDGSDGAHDSLNITSIIPEGNYQSGKVTITQVTGEITPLGVELPNHYKVTWSAVSNGQEQILGTTFVINVEAITAKYSNGAVTSVSPLDIDSAPAQTLVISESR